MGALVTFTAEQLSNGASITEALESNHIVFFPRSPMACPMRRRCATCAASCRRACSLKNISYHPEAGRDHRTSTPMRTPPARHADPHRTPRRGQRVPAPPAAAPHRGLDDRYLQRPPDRGARTKLKAARQQRAGACRRRRLRRHRRRSDPALLRQLQRSRGARLGNARVRSKTSSTAAAARRDSSTRTGAARRRFNKRQADRLRAVRCAASRASIRWRACSTASPYDRAMRRLHNYMKDNAAIQRGPARLRGDPLSAVLGVDGVHRWRQPREPVGTIRLRDDDHRAPQAHGVPAVRALQRADGAAPETATARDCGLRRKWAARAPPRASRSRGRLDQVHDPRCSILVRHGSSAAGLPR